MFIFRYLVLLLLTVVVVYPSQSLVAEKKMSEYYYYFYTNYFQALFKDSHDRQRSSSSLITLIRLENFLKDKMSGYDIETALDTIQEECKHQGYSLDKDMLSEYLAVHDSVNHANYSYVTYDSRQVIGPGTNYTAYFGSCERENQPIDPELQKRIEALPYRFTIGMSIALGGSFLVATRMPVATKIGAYLFGWGIEIVVDEILSRIDDYDGFEDEDAVYEGDLE